MLDSIRVLPSPRSALPRSLLLGASAVLGLLAMLATLQYRWLGQISEADQARLRTSAQSRADEFARDLDREITRAFLRLQFDAAGARALDAKPFRERWTRWKAVTAHPGLVKDVWLSDPSGKDVWRFEADAGSLGPSPWPEALATVRDRIQERAAVVRDARPRPSGSAPGPPFPRPGPGGVDFLDDTAHALVSPVPNLDRDPSPREMGFNLSLRLAGYTIVVLDSDYIRERLLPALARRHFGLDEDAEYAVLVTANDDPRTVVFRSSPRSATPGPGDASARLFGLRLEDAREDDLAAFSMPRPGPSPRGRPAARGFTLGRRGGGPPPAESAGRWRLVATHRAGSVDLVVAKARLRSLGVSAFILALLGVSVVLIVVSAQRARRLADRQLEFVAGVSHELRTPVTVIASAGENLADGLVSDLDMVRQYGRVVRDEARRLAEMVEQVLDFAGSYAGRRAYEFEAVDVGDVARECLDALRPALDESGGTIESESAPDLPRVRADRAALRRALLNLMQNAIKYGGEAPRIALRITSGPTSGRPEVRIAIEDHGLGITPGEKERLFEPFFRGEEARSRQIRGNGLGLSLVKRIVDAHSGRISVRSAPGKGSTFTVALPAASATQVEPVAASEETDGTPHTVG